MKIRNIILPLIFLTRIGLFHSFSQSDNSTIKFEFCDQAVEFRFDKSNFIDFNSPLSSDSIESFYNNLSRTNYRPIVDTITSYKQKYKLDDWLFYQLIRRTAEHISPKTENYNRYTLYKWFLLSKSGYNATLSISGDRLLFYVQSDDSIYNIPCHYKGGKQYVCLNYHDFGSIDFDKNKFSEVAITVPEAQKSFTYKINQIPDFKLSDYEDKNLQFNVNQNEYEFKIKLNPEIKTMFANYPVVDYESYFNIPLSKETYKSLMPLLKKNMKRMNVKNGVDYLMRFTRYAFLFEPDSENFGKEKRLSPEQTLLYDYSDCEDRAALFFYLVKEIYDLPMIVLSYPKHITIAVKFDKPIGRSVYYNGIPYSICEPTPQKEDLHLGQISNDLKKAPYEVVYAYNPQKK
ncbi:MAG: hypothetical protein ABUT20_03195 [Bacteroidota bacterium]